MEKVIEVNLYDKNDLTEKYNKKIASKDLIDYIIKEAMFVGKNDTIKVIINNECNLKNGYLEIIKDGLELEYHNSLKRYHLNDVKQLTLLLVGILFLFISTIIKNNFIFKEVFLIVGWVPIWEVIEI